jgi:hypothetical protein
MGKLIFWVVVFFVVLFVLRLLNVANSRSRSRDQRASGAPPAAAAMVRCVDCGVYLPSADATPGPRGPLCGDPKCLERAGKSGR